MQMEDVRFWKASFNYCRLELVLNYLEENNLTKGEEMQFSPQRPVKSSDGNPQSEMDDMEVNTGVEFPGM
jgi:hypothetical protein